MVTIMVIAGAPLMGHAAGLLAGSSQATLAVGDTATVSFYVDTQSQVINNGESVISFSKDIITIKSVSTQGSVFGMWVEQPTFSNATGTITFNGGVPNPGFQGTRGLLFTATVTAQKAGTAAINFGESSIRANDGLGTDILKQKTGITITVIPAVEKPVVPAVPAPSTETVPQIIPLTISDLDFFAISSRTHPDQSLWYASNVVELTWPLLKTTTGIQMALDSDPATDILGKTEKPVGSRIIKGLKDGVSYLHVKQIGKNTESPVAHFAIRVDTTTPTNTTAQVARNQSNDLVATISATDMISGVDYFQVLLDGVDLGKVTAVNGRASFVFPRDTALGKHILTIHAYDFARNKQEVVIPIAVEPFDPPVVTVTTKNILVGSVMTIAGEKAGSNQVFNVFIRTPEQKLEMYQVVSNAQGFFSMKNLVTAGGAYEIWVEPIDGMKAMMKPMTRQIVGISESIFYHIYTILDIASPIITLMIFIFVLVSLRKKRG